MPSVPAPRDYNAELTGILGGLDATTAAGVRQQISYNPSLTTSNLANYTNLLRGSFDAGAFAAATPGFQQYMTDAEAAGEMKGWTPAQMAAAYTGKNEGDASLNQYYQGGLAGQMRNAYDQANPALTAYNQQFGNTVNQLNGQGPASYNASGYNASGYQATGSGNQTAQSAALASFNPQAATAFNANQQFSNATTAQQQMANGGPLLGALNRSAAGNLDRVSSLQAQQQGIAQNLLSAGGGLTQGETLAAQDSARAAYSDRGLFRSNRGIGAEILATDAAQRNRLLSNLGIAQGVDAAGQAQIGQNRGFALGVQGQGQNLSTFNAGQGNSLGQFNAGLLTNNSQFNAGQGNSLSQFNAGLNTQNSQFNAGQFNTVGLNLANGNADRINQNNQFNSTLGQQNNQFNAGQVNDAARFNATSSNQAGQYNSVASNEANRFNAGMAQQYQNDVYNRSAGYSNFLLGQAQNPNQMAMGLMGNTPDYTSGLLGYGSDLYNTNFNAANARYIGAGNNNASMFGSGLGLIGQLGGAAISAFF